MIDTPEQVLARLDSDVDAMRRRGYGADADRMRRVAAEFREAIAPIELVPEHAAMLRSGKSRAWLRSRFEAWRVVGAATTIDDVYHYRLCVLPTRLSRAEGDADASRVLRAI